MVTAKEIREVRFSRGMRGYDTTEVDAFLDQCTAAVETLTAEKEENTRKMQVLAETIMDYRKQEDSIRSAVLNAQRMKLLYCLGGLRTEGILKGNAAREHAVHRHIEIGGLCVLKADAQAVK